MISVRLRNLATREIEGHVIYAFRNVFGKIQYMDRTVGNRVSAVYKNINDIGAFSKSAITLLQAAILHNVFVRTIGHELNRLVIPILGMIASEKKQ